MLPTQTGFTAYLYRPYLDLSPAVAGGPLHPYGIEFAYRSLAEERDYPWIYAELPPSFRERLLQVTGLWAYRVRDPRELPAALRTERWQCLCDELDRYDEMPPLTQFRVLRLLGKLGLHRAVLDRTPEPNGDAIAQDEPAAEMAYLRALARFAIHLDGDGPFSLNEFELIATRAPRGSPARIHALNQMVVQNAKRGGDPDAVASWLPLHRAEIEAARPSLDEFTYTLLLSRHHRAAGFLPQLRGDRAGVVREMDCCQEYAERLPRDSAEQCIAADELLYATLESRTKEALWLGDFALAEARARRLVALCPLEPRVLAHLGQVLVEQNKIAEALDTYLCAARLGAPEAEAVWFMAGQCYEELHKPERACDAYLAALRMDPLGIAAAERLVAVAGALGNQVLVSWSQTHLAALAARQAAGERVWEPARYQTYDGHLGQTRSQAAAATERES